MNTTANYRPTGTTPTSFEGSQFELVRRGLRSIEDARLSVETYRELRRASVARFVGRSL